MTETVQVAIISASLAALINCIYQLINKLIDLKKESNDKNAEEAKLYKEKKEQVYIAALDNLLQIRRGFDYTFNDYVESKKIREMLDTENSTFIKIAPKLRLYASDRIFREYQKLSLWSKYSYASMNEQRLSENSKRAFNVQVTLLAHLMQAELGYRTDEDEQDSVQCPDCGTVHDIVIRCPKCGMTYEQLQFKADEIFRQLKEEQIGFAPFGDETNLNK